MTAVNRQREEQGESIDLTDLFLALVRSWKLIAVCIFIALVAAILYLRVTRPIYAVDGLVQVESGQNVSDVLFGHAAGVTGGLLPDAISPSQTEIEIIQSRYVLAKVIHNLNLDITISATDNGILRRILTPVRTDITHTKDYVGYSSSGLSFQVQSFDVPSALSNQPFKLVFNGDGHFTLDLLNKKNIAGYENQPIMNGEVGQPLIVTLNGEILKFIIKNSKNSGSVYITKKGALKAAKDINTDLVIAEKGKMTGIIQLIYQGEDPQLITNELNEVMKVYYQQNIEKRTAETQNSIKFLDHQLPQLKADLESSESKFNLFRKSNNAIDVNKESELLLQQTVDLKTRKLELEQQQALLNSKYTSRFPALNQVKSQLSNLDQDSQDLEKKIAAMPELQSKYLTLYGDVQVRTVIYTSFLNSYQQLKVMNASTVGNVRLLDQAILPLSPIKPIKLLVISLAFVIGLVVGILLALLKRLLSPGVTDSLDIEIATGISVIATVPRSKMQERLFRRRSSKLGLLANEDSEDLAIESLRSLRTAVHFSSSKSKNNIILITGPSPEIGKSFISANFAVILAQMGKSVVLVDGDLRRGYLHEYYGLTKTPGLSDYLRETNIDLDAIRNPKVSNGLDFIPRGTAASNAADLLHNERFSKLMLQLSAEYDYVIIDSPPLLAATDGLIIADMAGMALVIARYGQTQMRELELSLSLLTKAGVSIEGIVFNDVRKKSKYDYQYGYQYRAKE
jgi:tyrosine-protein kinase Etk/Wzc